MNIEKNIEYSVAIYIRLSKEDGDKEESESVTNQRKILRAFAEENHYRIYDEYVDDGYTGTNFNRPDFKRMITDIENKKVNMIITKSLSRLGRDYIEPGRYIEKYFPENNNRYIAVLDDVDTWRDYRNEIIHGLLNKNVNSVNADLKAKVEDGMSYARFIDSQVKALKRKDNIRKKMKIKR